MVIIVTSDETYTYTHTTKRNMMNYIDCCTHNEHPYISKMIRKGIANNTENMRSKEIHSPVRLPDTLQPSFYIQCFSGTSSDEGRMAKILSNLP